MDEFNVGENGTDWEELVPKADEKLERVEEDDDLSVPSLVSGDDDERVEENYSSYDDIELSDDNEDHLETMLGDADVHAHLLNRSGPEPSTSSSRPVWCHVCNQHTVADFSVEEDELTCRTCHSNFVEEEDQGVEEFLEPRLPGGGDIPSPPLDSSQVVNQVLGRLFNFRGALQPLLHSNSIPVTVVGQDENGIHRPVGVLFRQVGGDLQPSSAHQANSFSALQARPQTASPASGILDLLLSLSSIRQGSPNFNNEDVLGNAQFEQFLHHVLMNENSHAGAPAATEEMIANLPSNVLLTNIEASAMCECSISQEAFEVGDVVLTLPCEHKFKQEPIVHWLKLHRTCPVCRVDITTLQPSEI